MTNITDTKFFTNQDGNSLYERFNHTLKNAQYFDSLVGYFRTSGFYRLYKSLENVEKIRILVGLNIDEQTFDIIHQAEQTKLLRDMFELWKQIKNEGLEEYSKSS